MQPAIGDVESIQSQQVTMPKYAAFLRAINVGGHTVKMDYLRRLFEGMGLSDVESFIASGNVIFDSTARNTKALEKKIEDCLHEALGYAVATFVRSISEVADIARYKPFLEAELNADCNSLYIAFVADKPGQKGKERLLSLTTKLDDFQVNGREVYWLCRSKRSSDSEFSGARLEKTLGMPATLRNSTTVRKIASKYSRL